MASDNSLESLQLQWAQLVYSYRDYRQQTPLDEYIPEAGGEEMVDKRRREPQTSQNNTPLSSAGVDDGRGNEENRGILWIILVLIEIGVVIWVLFTVMMALCTWWAGLFKSDQVEDREEGKGEEYLEKVSDPE